MSFSLGDGVLPYHRIDRGGQHSAIERTATASENIDLEGEVIVEESAYFVVKLVADPEAARSVDITDGAADIIPCLLRVSKRICL